MTVLKPDVRLMVTIPREDFLKAKTNRMRIALLIQTALRGSGGFYQPKDWRTHVLDNVVVTVEDDPKE